MILRPTLRERILHRLHLLPTPVFDAFGSVLFGRALSVAVRAGLFEALRDGSLGTGELARVTGLDRTAVQLLAESFVEGGYLRRSGNAYALNAESRRWLLRDSPVSIIHLIRYFETLNSRWAHLDESMVTGKPAEPYYSSFSAEDWEIYVRGMRDLARFMLPRVLTKIDVPRREARLLDVGGSHGLWAIECCRRSPLLSATVMDFEEPLRLTRRFVLDEKMGDRVCVLAGDFLNIEIPGNQDIVLLFNIIHGLSNGQNETLIGKLMRALAPGGKLYILDQVTTERGGHGFGKFLPLMVGLNLLNEIGGRAYSAADVRRWCWGARRVVERKPGIPAVALFEVQK
jgi:hypothetical protein